MRSVDRIRIAAGSAAAVAALAWVLPSLGAKPAPMSPPPPMAGGGRDEEPKIPRVYYQAPVSAEAGAVWVALQKKVAVKFPNETPFEDFLKFVQESTVTKEGGEGVMIYVDPVGIQEAEKTMSSPITLNLVSVRLETALKLALNQLEMEFEVHSDGIVYITAKHGLSGDKGDPNALILDRLAALQKEVTELRGIISSSLARSASEAQKK